MDERVEIKDENTFSLRDTLAEQLSSTEEVTDAEIEAPEETADGDDVGDIETGNSDTEGDTDTTDETEAPESEDEETGSTEDDDSVYEVDAPGTWTEEEKEYFESLPDELVIEAEGKEYDIGKIKRLTSEYQKNMSSGVGKKFEELAGQRKTYEQLDQVFNPYEQDLAKAGHSKASYVQALMQVDIAMAKDPAGTIKYLMESKGVTPDQLGISVAEADEWDDDYKDPNYAKLEAELNALKQGQTEAQTRAQQEASQKDQEALNAFIGATDADGELVHPHFDNEEVKQQMAVILRAGSATSLEDAYSKTVYVQSKKLEEAQVVRDKEATKKKRRKVTEAKKASKSVSNTAPSSGSTVATRSLREQLQAELRERKG